MTRSTIGGVLDTDALATLAGRSDEPRLRHFRTLPREEQAAAIRRLRTVGLLSETAIAAATKLSVEMIRRILAEKEANAGTT